MRLITFLLSFLAISCSLETIAQAQNQKVIALSVKPGTYTFYSETGKSISKAKITPIISKSESKVLGIAIDYKGYKAMRSIRSTWSSGFVDRENKNCLWIPDEGKSKELYELDTESNTVLKIIGYYGKRKPTETQTTEKLINKCLAIGQENKANGSTAQAKSQKLIALDLKPGEYTLYSEEGSSIGKAEIKPVVSVSGNIAIAIEIDREYYKAMGSIRSTWSSGFIRTRDENCLWIPDDGKSIVLYELDIESNTVLKIIGYYGQRKPTEIQTTKELINKCLAIGQKEMENDPVAQAELERRKKYSIERKRIDDAALAEGKEEEEEHNNKFLETKTIRSENGANTIANKAEKVKAIDVKSDFMLRTNLSMEVMGGFMGKKSYHLLGGKKYKKADYPGLAVTYKNVASGKESMDKSKEVNSYGSLSANAGTETEDGKLLLAANHALYYTDDVPKLHNSYINKELNFTAIQDLGNGKCVALASTLYRKKKMNHFASRRGLKLIIWDYKNSKDAQIIDLSSESVSAKPQLLKTSDGGFIISFDEFENEQISTVEKSYMMSFSSAKTRIYKLSLESGELKNIWGYELPELDGAELTDLIEARNGDIVFVLKSKAKRHESSNNNRNISSFIYLASMKANGSGFKYIKYDHLGHNKLRSSEKPKCSKYIYMGAVGRPFLFENPKESGYIVVHRPSLDVLKSNIDATEKFQDFPSFVTHNAESLKPEIIDIMGVSASSAHYQSAYRPYSTDPFTSEIFEIKDVQYNPVTNQIILVEEGLSTNDVADEQSRREGYPYSNDYRIGRVYIWALDYSIYEVDNPGEDLASDVDAATSNSNNNNSSNTTSSASTSNSSSSTSPKLVQVYVDPNKKGNATIKIYWKQDGQDKKFAMSNSSRRSIGYIPEGTKLSYSSDVDHNKKIYFYTVPSGKSSVSVTLK
jgi:hypothetical protein